MNKKYKYDEYYFQVIDSKEKAYWLGFIMADGCIQDNRLKDNKSKNCCLRIRLTESDKEHLLKFKKCLNGNLPIRIVKNYGIYDNCKALCEISVHSKKLVDSLYDLNFEAGNKSGHEFIPKVIKRNKEFTTSFLLGLFDGDGYISLTDKTHEFSISSSYKMCYFIKKFFEENLDVKFQKVGKERNGELLYRVRCGRINDLLIIRDFIYKNQPIYLSRKYEKFFSI